MLKIRLPLHVASLDIVMCTEVHTIFYKSAQSAPSAPSAQKCAHVNKTCTSLHFFLSILCPQVHKVHIVHKVLIVHIVHIKTKHALLCTFDNIMSLSAQSAHSAPSAQECT